LRPLIDHCPKRIHGGWNGRKIRYQGETIHGEKRRTKKSHESHEKIRGGRKNQRAKTRGDENQRNPNGGEKRNQTARTRGGANQRNPNGENQRSPNGETPRNLKSPKNQNGEKPRNQKWPRRIDQIHGKIPLRDCVPY